MQQPNCVGLKADPQDAAPGCGSGFSPTTLNALTLFKSAVSLGGTESLLCHPASTTHSGVPAEVREEVGVSEGLIRMSIGLEHGDDLIADLESALRA